MTDGVWPNGLPKSHFREDGRSSWQYYLDTRDEVEAAKRKQIDASIEEQNKKYKPTVKNNSNDKREAARRVFIANNTKSSNEIAKIIAQELEITYSNAYYYVTRVFRK